MTLKVRVIATLLWNGQTLVKGVAFDAWRPVGHPLQAVNVFQMREVDEIIFLDITATNEARRPNFTLIESLARECFVPLTVGGGVKSVDDVRDLLRACADKVSAEAGLTRPFAAEITASFGRQVLVGAYSYDNDERFAGPIPDCGEYLIQSQLRDGTMQGYHLPGIRFAAGHQMPIIASGGAGTYEHFVQAVEAGASAIAAGAMWLFTEQTPLEAKRYMASRGIPVRL